jgi:Amt family ammonium transporter
MPKGKVLAAALGAAALFLTISSPAWAAGTALSPADEAELIVPLLGSVLGFLVPIGVALIAVSGTSEKEAAFMGLSFLLALGLAAFGYLACGFAFQFGGVGIVSELPGLRGLIWEWSPLDVAWGTGWGALGLKGYFLAGPAATPESYALFFSQLPLVTTAVLVLVLALRRRTPFFVPVLGGLLMSAVIYPLAGNWALGGGWLANLGLNLGLGHGYVDFAGGGLANLLAATVALAGLVAFGLKRRAEEVVPTLPQVGETNGRVSSAESESYVPMPTVHLPLLAILGSMLLLVGWLGLSFGNPLIGVSALEAGRFSPAVVAVNLALAAAGGAMLAMLYSWFTTGAPDVLMSPRGALAGLVAVSAGAAFIPAWAALLLGALAGLLLPLVHYLVEQVLRLDDAPAALAAHGLPALVGLLAVGLFADGRYGQGWNGVGASEYLGVAGQGVSGLWAAPGFQSGWLAQFQAQLVGVIAVLVLAFVLGWLLFATLRRLIEAWRGTTLEPTPTPEVTSPVGTLDADQTVS